MNLYSTILVSICCISLTTAILGTDSQDSVNPQSWIKTYMCDNDGALIISQQDLHALLNLLYLSFARSRITLAAQDDGLQALQTSWQAFQNIIQLRRNPSKNLPYQIDKNTYAHDMNLLYDLQAEHRRIGRMYAAAVDAIMQGTLIADEHLKKGIQSIRDVARSSIVNALSNVKEYLDAILHTRTDLEDQKEELCIEPSKSFGQILNKSFSIGDYIWGLIPNLALNTFVKTDDLTITTSEEWWKGLYQLLNISNMIWKPIELARVELYLTYYKAVYLEAQSHNIDMTSMTFMFDEHGILDPDMQHDQLPNPQELRYSPLESYR